MNDAAHRAFALPGAEDRYGPDKVVEVLHIDLHLVPDLSRAHLDGVCTTSVRALDEAVSRLKVDARDLCVASVHRDGAPLAFSHDGKTLDIRFDPPIAPGDSASFSVAYSLDDPKQGMFFIRPTPEYPDRVPHVWTQSQDTNASAWFPCFDYPHAKQSSSATIVVPKGLFALSNGALTERRDEGGSTIFRYRQDVPHSTYLMTMVAGPFEEVAQRGASVPVYYYVLPGRQAEGERAFDKTPAMIALFEDRLQCPYPYARYSQIAVGEFVFGGMENTSATTQTDRTLHDERAHLDFSSDPLVSHELAHQWFGDLLTCRDWAHAWLNESFATYFEAVHREADLGPDEYVYDIFICLERYLEEDRQRYRRPIVYNRFRDPIELFDRHLYEKGAAVLHMLRGELGEARFWRSLRTYVADNAQRSVETIDLIRAIEKATGRNLRGFFDRWVFRGGHPELRVSCSYDPERCAAKVTIEQKQVIDEANPAFVFDVEVAFAPVTSGETERRINVRVERARETVWVPLEWEPAIVRFDPGAFVLADVTYDLGVALACAALEFDAQPVARIRAARELAKDASRRAREALGAAFEREAFWGVLAEAAAALGRTRAPWARDILLRALTHAHPKVRRAAAAALGAFRETLVADALLEPARSDPSYFVQAAALRALGKTRDGRAFDVLREAVGRSSWNGTVESGAAAGLGELADARCTPLLQSAASAGREEALRCAALAALARHAELLPDERVPAIESIERAAADSAFPVVRAAIAAAGDLADQRLLPLLDRVARDGVDGRIRRAAAEAATHVRESQKVPAQVTGLRTDLDALRDEQQKLREKIETLARP